MVFILSQATYLQYCTITWQSLPNQHWLTHQTSYSVQWQTLN